MKFIFISIFAYFLISLQVILDKFLLSSQRVSHPSVYAFYTGVLSLFSFILIPVGVYWSGVAQFFQYMVAGVLFIYGVLFLFFALKDSEASRVMLVVGAVVPVITYLFSLVFFREILQFPQVFGVGLLIGGGIMISWKMSEEHRRRKLFKGFSYCVWAAIFLAVSSMAFKELYRAGGFIHVFVWTRLGLVMGALSLLVYSSWRNKIIRSLRGLKKPGRAHASTGALFVGNKAVGGLGSIMVQYGISLGSVTVVNALISVEYVFIFIIGAVLSVKFPKIFHERYRPADIFEKAVAIVIITAGVALVTV